MGKVTGKTRGLDFIGNFEGETRSPLTPYCGVAGIVSVEKQRGGERLQIRREVHRRRRLAHTAFKTCDGDNHANSLYLFALIKIQTYKNTKLRRAMQGCYGRRNPNPLGGCQLSARCHNGIFLMQSAVSRCRMSTCFFRVPDHGLIRKYQRPGEETFAGYSPGRHVPSGCKVTHCIVSGYGILAHLVSLAPPKKVCLPLPDG